MKQQIKTGKLIAAIRPVIAFAILAMFAVWETGPIRAQNYDTKYPVCLHLFDEGGDRLECSYTSLAQCAGSASGRSAACEANPYSARARSQRR